MEELSVAALRVIVLVIRADERLLEHETLTSVSAGHHVNRTIGRGRHGGHGRGQRHLGRLFLIFFVIGTKEGIHRGALLLGLGHGAVKVLGLGHKGGKGREWIGIQAVEGDDGGGSGSADWAWVHSLNVAGGRREAVRLIDGENVLTNQARDIREDRSRGSGKVSSQLGRLDIGDQECQELLLSGGKGRGEEERLAGCSAVAGSERRGRRALRVHGKGGGK